MPVKLTGILPFFTNYSKEPKLHQSLPTSAPQAAVRTDQI